MPMGYETEDESGDATPADLGDTMDDNVVSSPIASTVCDLNSSISGDGSDEFQPESQDDPGFESGGEEMEDIEMTNDAALSASASGYAARKKAEKVRLSSCPDPQKERLKSLRSDVSAARIIPPSRAQVASSNKKKEEPHKGLKRCNAVLMGGFNADWKVKNFPASRTGGSRALRNANAKRSVSHNGFVQGDSHDDEPNEALEECAKAGKNTTSSRVVGSSGSHQAQTTEEMRVNLKQVAAMMSTGRAALSPPSEDRDRKRPHKQRYSLADLPFPRGGRDLHIWRRVFIPSLLGWVGTQENPFGANCQMEGEIVHLWKHIFPSIVFDQGSRNREIVLNVCDSVLNNWRSDMGKAGHRAVTDLWQGDFTEFALAEDRAEYVSDALMNLRFVYKYPDETNGQGAFCSDLISKVYAKHLRKISPEGGRYGPQIGGLALATVAVERALTLFKTGEDISKVNNNVNSGRGATRTSGHGFKDSLCVTLHRH
ncbi:hypothetical protein H4582DRAFT_2080706 [Lactarius indigo]|nr:hypothetical protein H4582DRAFT_2080706 [Lactarius indigo]